MIQRHVLEVWNIHKGIATINVAMTIMLHSLCYINVNIVVSTLSKKRYEFRNRQYVSPRFYW